MTESEWRTATFGLLLMQEADHRSSDEDGSPTWRSVAARVGCLAPLGPAMPAGVRRWVAAATAYLDGEDRLARADRMLYEDRDRVYAAFREAYALADPTLQQRLAAAQDVFRGRDYYAEDHYMLEEDESSPTYTGPAYAAESAAHCDIIRCVFGNPFRRVTLDPAVLTWNDSAVVRLAQSAYDERRMPEGTLDNGRLAILADAFEEAGCRDQDILAHCRSGSEHVRGCWVIDAVLERS